MPPAVLFVPIALLALLVPTPFAQAGDVYCNKSSSQHGWQEDCVGYRTGSEGICVYQRNASGYYDADRNPVTVYETENAHCVDPLNWGDRLP